MATKARIAGSGYTYMTYNGETIAFCEVINDSGEELTNAVPERIHPIGMKHPFEICSCEATNGGTITLTIRETWDNEVWNNLPFIKDNPGWNIGQLVNRDEFSLQKIIVHPDNVTIRGKIYHGCRITGIQSGENITVGTITLPKTVTISYTHTSPII